jgi:hypothetical protein
MRKIDLVFSPIQMSTKQDREELKRQLEILLGSMNRILELAENPDVRQSAVFLALDDAEEKSVHVKCQTALRYVNKELENWETVKDMTAEQSKSYCLHKMLCDSLFFHNRESSHTTPDSSVSSGEKQGEKPAEKLEEVD